MLKQKRERKRGKEGDKIMEDCHTPDKKLQGPHLRHWAKDENEEMKLGCIWGSTRQDLTDNEMWGLRK